MAEGKTTAAAVDPYQELLSSYREPSGWNSSSRVRCPTPAEGLKKMPNARAVLSLLQRGADTDKMSVDEGLEKLHNTARSLLKLLLSSMQHAEDGDWHSHISKLRAAMKEYAMFPAINGPELDSVFELLGSVAGEKLDPSSQEAAGTVCSICTHLLSLATLRSIGQTSQFSQNFLADPNTFVHDNERNSTLQILKVSIKEIQVSDGKPPPIALTHFCKTCNIVVRRLELCIRDERRTQQRLSERRNRKKQRQRKTAALKRASEEDQALYAGIDLKAVPPIAGWHLTSPRSSQKIKSRYATKAHEYYKAALAAMPNNAALQRSFKTFRGQHHQGDTAESPGRSASVGAEQKNKK